ncbi:MAG: MBOAT family protein [Phycisphaerae bacterium]|nr:MBOAT family protein [Phycisphaerae bacterium]
MIFNSLTYLVFLCVAVVLYRTLGRRMRLWMVFLSSCVFYGFWRWEFLPIVLFSTATDYIAALQIARHANRRPRVVWLCTSLAVNLGLLFYFKYTAFFVENVWSGLALLGIDAPPFILKITLPLGISFYTFQTISYTVDVYRRIIPPEKDFVLYAGYVMFFPQLVAGPILRAKEVIGQLSRRGPFELTDLGAGLRRIVYGLFLKVFLADTLAGIVDNGFGMPAASLGAWDVWTLAFLFGFQIYFDFSAYSHIAIGSARLMGIRLIENFNFPYMACSPREFWQRWHISLSSWIRDYLYLPLCGATVEDRSAGGLGKAAGTAKGVRTTYALFATWAIMGLWHGANWTFVLWGLQHAAIIVVYRAGAPVRERLPQVVRVYGGWAVTLGFAMLAWIAFRTQSVSDAGALYGRLLDPQAYLWRGLKEQTYLLTALMLGATVLCAVAQQYALPVIRRRRFLWATVETAGLAAITALVIIFLRPINQFIYFQF